jgi:sugar lactone lactonase YvrE
MFRRLTRERPLRGSNGIAFGPDGRLYVAQFLGGRIGAVDLASAEVEDVVPAGGPIEAPDDLAFGADGSMYVTDLVPGRVWRRTPEGAFDLVSDQVRAPNGIACVGNRLFVNEMVPGGRLLELFPGGGEPVVLTGGLAMGNAMQLGPDGALYYPHMLTGEVFRIPPDGGSPELVADRLPGPVAVRFDAGGALLVISRGPEGIVTRIESHGSGERSTITSGVVGLDNAAFDTENRMYVSSFASGGILELHPDGRTRDIVRRGLTGPYGIATAGGTVFAADHYRFATPATDPDDEVTTHELTTFVHGIAATPDELHVTSQFGNVRTYDRATRQIRERAKGLDRPQGLTVTSDGILVVAETEAGRLLAIAPDDTVTVLATDLPHPIDVALPHPADVDLHEDVPPVCFVSVDGAVVRVEDGRVTPVAEGLDGPQGITVLGSELIVVETGARRLLAVDIATGAQRVVATELPLPAERTAEPALFAYASMPGVPRRFAGVAAGPDGTLYVAGDGTVLAVQP